MGPAQQIDGFCQGHTKIAGAGIQDWLRVRPDQGRNDASDDAALGKAEQHQRRARRRLGP